MTQAFQADRERVRHMGYSWLSIHRVNFKDMKDSKEGAPSGPASASAWRFGPHAPLADSGFRKTVSRKWGGVGFYKSRELAEAVVDAPYEHLGFLGDAEEDWHALACVIAYRGESNWSTPTEPHPVLVPTEDPGGVLAVITSAGYVSPDESEFPRIKDFLKRIEDVIEFYGTLEANTARCLFNAVEAREGMTFSVWTSDKEMMASAYRAGVHADYLARHQASPMFDYSSFTRLRLLKSAGLWNGVDPRLEALARAV